jgi:glutamate-5-semialdehyde dehydrogenase
MIMTEKKQLQQYCLEVAAAAKNASRELLQLDGADKNRWLLESARQLRLRTAEILEANAEDIAAAPQFGLTDAQIDRLRLNESRIDAIARGLEEVAALPDPVGEVIESHRRPNGLSIQKTRVPLGVVFFVYESRPNVTADAAAICVKSGNAVILRGGKEAAHSSRAIVQVLEEVGGEMGIPAGAVQLVATPDREAVGHFLKLDQYIDLAIPRGGEGLIRRVASEATMPVIKHFNGNCHVYVDSSASMEMALSLTVNSKCHRYGVCNAAESLLVHEAIAAEFLPRIAQLFEQEGVEIRGDEATCKLLRGAVPATEQDYGEEYLAPIISVKVVADVSEAIDHIARYGSGHTETIVANNYETISEFTTKVDSSAVMVNASTRFNDGGEFGLGAEIGISTDKFHARGPCGLKELTSYKYVVYGHGQVRR